MHELWASLTMKKWILVISSVIVCSSLLLLWISQKAASDPNLWWTRILLWLGVIVPAVVGLISEMNDILQLMDRFRSEREKKDTFEEELDGYLQWMQRKYSRLNLRGIEERHQKIHRLTLDNVYVSLSAALDVDTRTVNPMGQEGPRPAKLIDMRELLVGNKCLAIVGSPGSGKTTFLHLVASTLAEDLHKRETKRSQELLGLQTPLPLPILITLSEYNHYRRQQQNSATGSTPTLRSFISTHFMKDELNLPSGFFDRMLENRRPCILMLDGLDEVANEDERILVREAVEDLADSSKVDRVVMTSRTHAYYGQSRLADFRTAFVQPMVPEQVNRLVQRWTHSVYEDKAQQEREQKDLELAIWRLESIRRKSNQPPLIDSPLMVTIVAIVHYNEHHLPEQRAELYEKCIDVLLAEKTDRPQEVRIELTQMGGSPNEKRQLLAYLAYRMMLSGKETGREVSEHELKAWLRPQIAKLYSQKASEQHVIAFTSAIRERGSIVAERSGVYSFIHLTFQEYLAAYHLAENLRNASDIIDELKENDRAADTWWRETVLLLIGYLGQRNSDLALRVVRELAEGDTTPAAQLRITALAADAFVELEKDHSNTRDAIRDRLQKLLSSPVFVIPSPIRVQGGVALSRLGDERAGVGLYWMNTGDPKVQGQQVPDIRFCYVPAGTFQMGAGRDAHDNSCCNTPYWISRYPITYNQYTCFVNAGGYDNGSYWEEASRNRFWQDGLVEGYYDTAGRNKPIQFPDPFLTANHPVVGISWYEAQAFTRWLMAVLHLPSDWLIQLPSEAEWEKAARGGVQIPEVPCVADWQLLTANPQPEVALVENPYPFRSYVWGAEEITEDHVNCGKTIGHTSAVGIYPRNESPYGVQELLGNVWEWTRSIEGFTYPYCPDEREDPKRVVNRNGMRLCGGSWWVEASKCTCSGRYGNYPYRGDYGLGFRIVLSLPRSDTL